MTFRISLSDDVEHIVATRSWIDHIEIDRLVANWILFTNGDRISATNISHALTVIGGNFGYREGSRFEAKFKAIYGFTQLRNFSIVIADPDNNCLRLYNRLSYAVRALYGQCGANVSNISYELRFLPVDVILGRTFDSKLLISERGKRQISEFDASTGEMDLRKYDLQAHLGRLSLMKIFVNHFQSNAILYFSGLSYISKLNLNSLAITRLVGGKDRGDADGSFGHVRLNYPSGIAFISSDILLLADKQNKKLKVMDLTYGTVATLCADMDPCNIQGMEELLIYNGYLLVGSQRQIAFIRSKFTLFI